MVKALRRTPWWVWVSGLPFGLGAWASLVPASQLKRGSWALWGALWTFIALTGWVLAVAQDGGTAGGLLIILGWAGAVATCTSIRGGYARLTASSWQADKLAAAERLRERQDALRMAVEQPALAAELGVGRPDRPGARDGGVVDVNNAPAAVLAELPGFDDALATRVAETRAQVNGFSSLADMGGVMDLDGNQVERLREHAVFLPR